MDIPAKPRLTEVVLKPSTFSSEETSTSRTEIVKEETS